LYLKVDAPGGFGALLTVWFKLCELCIVETSVALSNLRVLDASGALYGQRHLPIKTVFFRPPAKFVKIKPSLAKLDRALKLKASSKSSSGSSKSSSGSSKSSSGSSKSSSGRK
jgi:hypothetical protein